MNHTFSLQTNDELIARYAAHRNGSLQLSDDELMALEEELAGRTIESDRAWQLLALLRGK